MVQTESISALLNSETCSLTLIVAESSNNILTERAGGLHPATYACKYVFG